MDRSEGASAERDEGGARVGVALLRAADELRRKLGELTEPHGLTPQQYNVLVILRDARPNPVPTLEIGRRLMDRTPGTSRLLERLEAKGLVRRERPASNRRIVNCWITARGLEAVDGAEEGVRALNVEVGQLLGSDSGLVTRLEVLAARLGPPAGDN